MFDNFIGFFGNHLRDIFFGVIFIMVIIFVYECFDFYQRIHDSKEKKNKLANLKVAVTNSINASFVLNTEEIVNKKEVFYLIDRLVPSVLKYINTNFKDTIKDLNLTEEELANYIRVSAINIIKEKIN